MNLARLRGDSLAGAVEDHIGISGALVEGGEYLAPSGVAALASRSDDLLAETLRVKCDT